MKLSILVPVYNEEETIRTVLGELVSIHLNCQKEIIVINDGSTDQTKIRILDKIGKENIILLNHTKNQGKGAAIATGIKRATGDYILIQDADLEYKPSEISILLHAIDHGRHNAVYGSRFHGKKAVIPFMYRLGNKFLTLMTNILYGTKLSDMETGYKLIPTSFFRRNIPSCKKFDIEPEITAKLIKNHIPIVEVPISYKGRSHLAGKKLTVSDAFSAIKTLLVLRFFNR